MIDAWGPEATSALRRRLQQLAALENVDDLACLPCEVVTQPDGELHVSTHGALSIILTSEHEPPDPSGSSNQMGIIIEDIRTTHRRIQ